MQAKYFIIVKEDKSRVYDYVYPVATETELVERVNSYIKQFRRKLITGTFEVIEIDNMTPELDELFFGIGDGPHVEWCVGANGHVFGSIPKP